MKVRGGCRLWLVYMKIGLFSRDNQDLLTHLNRIKDFGSNLKSISSIISLGNMPSLKFKEISIAKTHTNE
uniref:Uncharacterized protein n=1 Tax=Cannabis sativa TaxID=3483 RepID=A0A803QXU5_CANSA